MLVGCAHNPFFLDALRRVNRLRRLVEYRITVDRTRLPIQCREHINILTLLEKGLRQEASDFLRTHIEGAGLIKTGYASTAATTPANFTADRILTFKDSSGTTYRIPCRASAW